MPVSSMTGFARAAGSHAGFAWVVEIRSVNGRGLDMRLRLPAPFDAFEADIRARLQKALARGNVQLSLTPSRETGAAPGVINDAAFLHYAEQVERLTWAAKLAAPTVGDILRLPGVIETRDAAAGEIEADLAGAALASIDEAVDSLVEARRREGAALTAIVRGLIDDIDAKIAEAEIADRTRREAIPARLRAQIAQLGESGLALDADRLHQEAVLIASRIDVREELDRLKAHVGQARTLLGEKGAVGRKLDFLTQEFVRESNTLCAKANDLTLTRVGLDLKALVEQFREQIQNIE